MPHPNPKLPYRRINLKMPHVIHAKLVARCKAEKVTLQRKLMAMLRRELGLTTDVIDARS